MKSRDEKHSGWLLIIGIIVGVLALTAGPALAALTFSGTSISGNGAVVIDSSSTISIGTSTATGVTIGNGSSTVTLPGGVSIAGSLTAPLTLLSTGGVGTYSLNNSGIIVRNASGTELFRLWGSDPDTSGGNALAFCLTDYNCFNLYLGYQAGFGQQSDNTQAGYRNIGIGVQPLYSVTSGFDNLAIGTQSLFSLTQGSDNEAYGYGTLHGLTTGQSNTAMGNSALDSANGNNNTAVGAGAGELLNSGDHNSFFGSFAGGQSGYAVTNTTALGADTQVTASNEVVIGDSNVKDAYFGSEAATSTIHASKGIFGSIVGVGTTAPSTTLQVAGASSTIRIGTASLPGCLEMGNSNGSAGINYVTFLNGVMTATTTKPSACQ